jgi:hypothetical protein
MQHKHHDVVTGGAHQFSPRTKTAAHIASIAVLIVASGCASPPLPPVNSDLPEGLRARPGAVLDDVLSARGDVIYECDRGGNGLSWMYRGVESSLFNSTGKRIGTAAPGGYFTADDGSYAVTRTDAKASMGQDSLPWARLVSRFNAGPQAGEGRFARTDIIQRVNTKGGLAPDGTCADEGAMLYAPYSATYLIYRAPGGSKPTQSKSSANAGGLAALSGKELPLPDR